MVRVILTPKEFGVVFECFMQAVAENRLTPEQREQLVRPPDELLMQLGSALDEERIHGVIVMMTEKL